MGFGGLGGMARWKGEVPNTEGVPKTLGVVVILAKAEPAVEGAANGLDAVEGVGTEKAGAAELDGHEPNADDDHSAVLGFTGMGAETGSSRSWSSCS